MPAIPETYWAAASPAKDSSLLSAFQLLTLTLLCLLQVPQQGIASPGSQKAGMRSLFDDTTGVKHIDHIGVLDGRQSVRHCNDSLVRIMLDQLHIYPAFQFVVQSGCGLIQDYQRCVLDQRSREGYALS